MNKKYIYLHSEKANIRTNATSYLSWTWNIPTQNVLNGYISVKSIQSINATAITTYTIRLLNIPVDNVFDDYSGFPVLYICKGLNDISTSKPTKLNITNKTISQISLNLTQDVSEALRDSGLTIASGITFIICLEIEDFNPEYMSLEYNVNSRQKYDAIF